MKRKFSIEKKILSFDISSNKKTQNKKIIFLPGSFSNPIGGPNRFINMFKESKYIDQNGISFQFKSYRNCTSALGVSVFPFHILFKLWFTDIKKVLRVDGIYVAEDRWKNLGRKKTLKEHFINFRVKHSILSSQHVIFQSQFSKKLACDHFKIMPLKSSVIRNGTNINHFKPSKRPDNKLPKIAVFGKHYSHQIDFAFEVFFKLLEKVPCELVLIGAPRNNEFTFDSIINKWKDKVIKLGGNIELVGKVSYDEIPSVLSKQDVLLHVKYGDSCPNSVIEAMSCGVPVVCPDWGGTKELVGEAGLIIPVHNSWKSLPEHVDGFSNALMEILTEGKKYKLLARQRVEQNFNIETISKTYAEILT